MRTMRQEATTQAVQGSVAIGGAVASAWTLNEYVMMATLLFIGLQAAFLACRWWWQWRDRIEGKRGKYDH